MNLRDAMDAVLDAASESGARVTSMLVGDNPDGTMDLYVSVAVAVSLPVREIRCVLEAAPSCSPSKIKDYEKIKISDVDASGDDTGG